MQQQKGSENMLVLSRKQTESLVIEGLGTITVQRIVGRRVVLGFDMPTETRIRRSELAPLAKPADDKNQAPTPRKESEDQGGQNL